MPTIKPSDFLVNSKFEGRNSSDKTLVFAPDPTKKLRLGEYTFQLVVTDDANNVSAPTTHRILVVDETKPTAIISGPLAVGVGKAFTLGGEESFDPDEGLITKFTWTLISVPRGVNPL